MSTDAITGNHLGGSIIVGSQVTNSTFISYTSNVNAKFAPNFDASTVPQFTSRIYPRIEEGDKIYQLIKDMARNPREGFVAIYGEGGVGKSTLVAELLHDEQTGIKLVEECNLHVAIWLNCYQWRREVLLGDQCFQDNKVAQKAFIDGLVVQAAAFGFVEPAGVSNKDKGVHDAPSLANVNFKVRLASILHYFKQHGERRVLFVLDDVFNDKIVECLRNACSKAICCLITREPDAICCSNAHLLREDGLYKLDTMADENIKCMLSDTFRLRKGDERLTEEEIDELVGKCCQLPLIASLIAAQFGNLRQHGNTSRQRYEYAFKEFRNISIGSKAVSLPDRQTETVRQLFESSINRMEPKDRIRYYAFLFFDPVEQISPEYMAAMWQLTSREAVDLCFNFVNLSLLRPLKTENGEDRYVVHQLLHESAVANLLERYTKNVEATRAFDGGAWLAAIKHLDDRMLDGRSDCFEKCLQVLERCLPDSKTRNWIEYICRRLPINPTVDLFTAKLPQQSMPFLRRIFECYDKELAENVFDWLTDDCDDNNKLIHLIMAIGGVAGIFNLLSKYDLRRFISKRLLTFDLLKREDEDKTKEPPWKKRFLYFKRRRRIDEKAIDVLMSDALYAAILTGSEVDLRRQISASDPKDEEFRLKFKGAVFIACEYENLEALEALDQVIGEDWQSVLTKRYACNTPIQLAIRNECIDIVKFLHRKCPQAIKQPDYHGDRPIWYATETENLDLVKFIHELDRDAISIQKQTNGQTPLQEACSRSSLEVIECLPEAIRQVDKDGDTPLHSAIRHYKNDVLEIVEFLYSKYEDAIKIANNKGETPLWTACRSGNIKSVEFLYEKYLAAVKLFELSKNEIETLITMAEQNSSYRSYGITWFLQERLSSLPNTAH